MRIIIAFDGSEHARAAVCDLRRAGLPADTEALVVTCADSVPLLPLAAGGRAALHTLAAATQMESASGVPHMQGVVEAGCAWTRQHLARWRVRGEVLPGPPAAAIVQRAREWQADLIVTGDRGRTRIGRLMRGSVSRDVATTAPCSVRVARAGRAGGSICLVVGVDGTCAARDIVAAVAGRCWPHGTDVRIVAVDDRLPPTAGTRFAGEVASLIAASNAAQRQRAQRQAMAAARLLRDAAALNVEVALYRGSAPAILRAAAEEWNADAIFVGARPNSSGVEIKPSTAAALSADAPCSVEIVRPRQSP